MASIPQRIERSRRPHLVQAIVYVNQSMLDANAGSPTGNGLGVTLGTSPHSGCLILTKIDDNSPFQHCEMQVGDKVYKINNERCIQSTNTCSPEWAAEQFQNVYNNASSSNLLVALAVVVDQGDNSLMSTTIVNPPPSRQPSSPSGGCESWMGIGFQVNNAICRLVVGHLDQSAQTSTAGMLRTYSCLWQGDECVSINGCDCRVASPSVAVTTIETTNQGGPYLNGRVVTLVTKPCATNEDAVLIRKQQSSSCCCDCFTCCSLLTCCPNPGF